MSDPKKGGNQPPKKNPKSIWTILFIALVVTIAINSVFNLFSGSMLKEISYDEFLDGAAHDTASLAPLLIAYEKAADLFGASRAGKFF